MLHDPTPNQVLHDPTPNQVLHDHLEMLHTNRGIGAGPDERMHGGLSPFQHARVASVPLTLTLNLPLPLTLTRRPLTFQHARLAGERAHAPARHAPPRAQGRGTRGRLATLTLTLTLTLPNPNPNPTLALS